MSLDLYYRFDVYSKALRIRMVEQEIAKRYPEGFMRCPVHLSIGQEMNAVAIAGSLSRFDFMVSTHRGHAHYLAKGGSLVGLLGELYGKDSGCSGGHGGSMHLVDRACGFLGSTSIVGGTIPIGVGAAFADRYKGLKNLSVVCIGDAAIEEGVFHEAANFASLHKLKVVFFMENNKYSCFTHLDDRQPGRFKGVSGFRSVAYAHDMSYLKINVESYYDDFRTLQVSLKHMKQAETCRPLFVECDAYRFVEHCGPNEDDHLNYRPKEDVDYAKHHDPLHVYEQYLRNSGFLDADMKEELEAKIREEINKAFDTVLDSYLPIEKDMGGNLYA